ncbi:putative transcription factor C2H2 family [Helianthus annuus]|nr:putative transcription factor C2H2 family [Helianthus annuus]KAJ0726634.1 putative transcription factor C2H2 family [Helianthus annuus]
MTMSIVITIRKLCKPRDNDDDCDDDDPPPTLEDHHPLSPLKILLICTLAATFAFLCYIILTKICRAFQTRRRRRINNNTNETPYQEPVLFHPVWLINTIGLDQSMIDSIQMFKYRKEDDLIDSDCPVCLGVFEEEESLRLLPKCSHAFHVACIDTWLRSHKNCPLCRAPVVNTHGNNSVESSTQEEDSTPGTENTNGVRVQSDLTNHCCQKLEPIRRSLSMGSFQFFHQESAVSPKPNAMLKSGKPRGSSSRAGRELV